VTGRFDLLFAAGDHALVTRLCDACPTGRIDEQALYIHSSLIPTLDPVLRVYIGCSEVLHGDVSDADILKIHKRSGKLTLLYYNSFEHRLLPVLKTRVKIWLKGQRLDVFDHGSNEEEQVLYHKDLYVGEDHPHRVRWRAYSERLEQLIGPIRGLGPTKQELSEMVAEKGYDLNLRPRKVD